MLEIVSKGFKSAKAALTGKTELTEENINAAVREIRVSLLEADVEIGVVRTFIKRVKDRAIGEVVHTEVKKKGGKKVAATPGDALHSHLPARAGKADGASRGNTHRLSAPLHHHHDGWLAGYW